MRPIKYLAIRAVFEALCATRLTSLIRANSKSKGVILTMHRVLPGRPQAFSPHAILQITPDFLDYAIRRIRALGIDIVSLDEAISRIENPNPTRKFVVLTFDDGYRDNLIHALPVLRHHQAPFTLYVPTALVDGVGEVWWQALEDIISAQKAIQVTYLGVTDYLACSSVSEKVDTYNEVYWRMRQMPESDRVALIHELAGQYGFDLAAHCRDLIMNWTELRHFANDPLCTIGAHTVHHYELAKLDPVKARNEIEQSVKIIESQFGKAPQHLSYPIGGKVSAGPREYALARDLGFRSAVTTLPGGVYHADKDNLHSLPRVSLNGSFQARRYVDIYATGTIFSTIGRIGS